MLWLSMRGGLLLWHESVIISWMSPSILFRQRRAFDWRASDLPVWIDFVLRSLFCLVGGNVASGQSRFWDLRTLVKFELKSEAPLA